MGDKLGVRDTPKLVKAMAAKLSLNRGNEASMEDAESMERALLPLSTHLQHAVFRSTAEPKDLLEWPPGMQQVRGNCTMSMFCWSARLPRVRQVANAVHCFQNFCCGRVHA